MAEAVKAVQAEPKQRRGRERREALLRAALDVLAEGGMKAVTHRAVATRAGLPLASTTYYFDSIEQLTEDALRYGVDRRVERLGPFAAATRDPDQSVPDLARSFVAAVIDRPKADIVAQLEVYLEAARNPSLGDGAKSAIESFEGVAASALRVVSDADPHKSAIALTALIDGFALHRIARPLDKDLEFETMMRALRAIFIAHVATDDELAVWLERLRKRASSPDSASVEGPPSSVASHG